MNIRNRKLKKFITSIKRRVKNITEKLNVFYIAILLITLAGLGLLVVSYWITDTDAKNIAVGLGTGVVSSTLVTLYLEIINAKIEAKKMAKYKRMLLNPLCSEVKSLYIQIALRVNEYRIREENEKSFLLPLEDTKELSDFFNKMEKVDIEAVDDPKKKKRIEEFSSISLAYFSDVISQYKSLPFESLILDNIITQEEYHKLKQFTLFNECEKCLRLLNENNLSEKERFYNKVHLLHGMTLFINRLMKNFEFITSEVKAENEWISEHLNDIFYNEVYAFSDEYIEQWAERENEKAEFYAEHPELLENQEESEDEQLYRKITDAVWAGDIDTIKNNFPKIDKNHKETQSVLTWNVAKDVMKDKELRRLYYEKYGIKYKMRKEKRRKR